MSCHIIPSNVRYCLFLGLVDIFEDDYHQSNISYTGLPLWDNPICNIGPYLAAAADIINDAIVNDGKIIVTCQMGVSRYIDKFNLKINTIHIYNGRSTLVIPRTT